MRCQLTGLYGALVMRFLTSWCFLIKEKLEAFFKDSARTGWTCGVRPTGAGGALSGRGAPASCAQVKQAEAASQSACRLRVRFQSRTASPARPRCVPQCRGASWDVGAPDPRSPGWGGEGAGHWEEAPPFLCCLSGAREPERTRARPPPWPVWEAGSGRGPGAHGPRAPLLFVALSGHSTSCVVIC